MWKKFSRLLLFFFSDIHSISFLGTWDRNLLNQRYKQTDRQNRISDAIVLVNTLKIYLYVQAVKELSLLFKVIKINQHIKDTPETFKNTALSLLYISLSFLTLFSKLNNQEKNVLKNLYLKNEKQLNGNYTFSNTVLAKNKTKKCF